MKTNELILSFPKERQSQTCFCIVKNINMVKFSLLWLVSLLVPFAASGLAATRTTSIVTGANGFVGRAIVHELLEQQQEQESGQKIVCLVRPQRIVQEEAYWKECVKPSTTCLEVMAYDMLDGGTTLRAALDQCREGDNVRLYHVASVFGPTENHEETARENVKGTCDVLETVNAWRNENKNQQSSCKVILTSSMAAVRGTGQDPGNGKYYTASDWNTASKLGANWGASYQWSKKESEQRARELADKYDIPLISLCPSFVFGPPYGEASSSFSIQLVRQWAKGESPVQSRLLVDIRDVAKAHVRAGQVLEQSGRYIVSTDARVPSRTLANWIRDVTDPRYRDAIHSDDAFTGGAIAIGEKEVNAEAPLRDALGITLRPIQETMQDMTVRLLQQEHAAETSESR